MTSTPLGKLCRICGADCAGRPRIKDPKGRYYCKACYEHARAEHAAAAPAIDADDDLLAGLVDDAPPVVSGCPNCAAPMAGGAILCVTCGYSVATGAAIPHAAVVRAPRAPAAREPAWPVIIGFLSVLLGAGSVLGNAALLVTGLRDGGGWTVALRAVLPMLLGAWLLLGGIGVFRRTQGGYASLRRWAIVKLTLTLICTGTLLVFTMNSAEIRAKIAQGLGPQGAYIQPAQIALIVLAATLWSIAWPVVLLAWFSRTAVQRDVETW